MCSSAANYDNIYYHKMYNIVDKVHFKFIHLTDNMDKPMKIYAHQNMFAFASVGIIT